MSAPRTGSATRTIWRVMLVASLLVLGWAVVLLVMAATGHSNDNVAVSAVVCVFPTLAALGSWWQLRTL